MRVSCFILRHSLRRQLCGQRLRETSTQGILLFSTPLACVKQRGLCRTTRSQFFGGGRLCLIKLSQGRFQPDLQIVAFQPDLCQLCADFFALPFQAFKLQECRCEFGIQISLGRPRGGKQRQRILRLLALRLECQGHCSEFRTGVFEPVAQRLSCGRFCQPRGLFLAQRLCGGVQILRKLPDLRFCIGVSRAQIRHQRIERLAAGSGQTRRLFLRVHLVTRGCKREVQRLLLAHQSLLRALQVGALLLKCCNVAQCIIPLRNQSGNLCLKAGDLSARCFQCHRLSVAGRRECCDAVFGIRKRRIQRTDPVAQILRGLLFKAESLRQGRNLARQLVELAFLSGDAFRQHKLHDHKDCQNEHQYQQKACHRVDETRPDRRLKPCACASRERHDQLPSEPGGRTAGRGRRGLIASVSFEMSMRSSDMLS